MKRLILGVAAALVLSAGPAAADGMPTNGSVRAPVAAAGPNWNGFYVGAGIGAGAVVHDIAGIFDGIGGEGVIGSIGVGYDRMITSSLVAGVFADYDFSGISTDIGPISADHDYSWALGARLGVLINPATLLYGTAGYTQAEFSIDGFSQDFDGYFLGAGLESFVSKDWTLKLEYRFSQFDDEFVLGFLPVEPSLHTARLGLSYKFGHR